MLPLKMRRAIKPATAHPAKFSEAVLVEIERLAQTYNIKGPTLDPFAGVGKVFDLAADTGLEPITACEIEEEWAADASCRLAELEASGGVLNDDFFAMAARMLQFDDEWHRYGAIITSCTYGNRMADHHEARDESVRNTYRHKLGRPLTPGNSGGMQWGDDAGSEYKLFHVRAWRAVRNLLAPGGWFILNVSDFIRNGEPVEVVKWHRNIVTLLGLELVEDRLVSTPRNGFGANGAARVDGEHVLVFRKPLAAI